MGQFVRSEKFEWQKLRNVVKSFNVHCYTDLEGRGGVEKHPTFSSLSNRVGVKGLLLMYTDICTGQTLRSIKAV